MGKKTKKTKWRTLEISLPMPGKQYRENGTGAHLQWGSNKYQCGGACDKIIKTPSRLNVYTKNSSSEENQHMKTPVEDEYTKITTPRQDVLFKKSYLTKRKMLLCTDAGCCTVSAENATDDDDSANAVIASSVGGTRQNCIGNYGQEFCDYANMATTATEATSTADRDGSGGGDTSSLSLSPSHPQLMCATSQLYMNASSAAATIYYGGGYEIYDPYTGNVATVVAASGAAVAAACQPILTSVPLQSFQWFNPVPASAPPPTAPAAPSPPPSSPLLPLPPSSTSEWCNISGAYAQQDDVTVTVLGTDTSGASKTFYSHDVTLQNVDEPASESSSIVESTTPTGTTGDGGGCPHNLDPIYSSQSSYVYPSYVLGMAAHNLPANDDGIFRYCSPASPMFGGNETTTSKRKKKRKRRRCPGVGAILTFLFVLTIDLILMDTHLVHVTKYVNFSPIIKRGKGVMEP